MYADRRSKEFINGVHYFLRVTEANKHKGFICCPCNKCKNQKEYSSGLFISTCLSRGSCQAIIVGHPTVSKWLKWKKMKWKTRTFQTRLSTLDLKEIKWARWKG
jgi:hypothetical protein